MAKVRDYHKLALDIIDVVGGQKNIVNATRCATRLRLVLKETPEGAKEKVSALAGVITVVENNGQFQVVIGTHVGEVYDSVAEALHLDASAQEIEQPKQNIVNRIIATMSAVFAPFVYILAAAGLLQGALILITMAAPSFAETGTYEVLNFMSWTPFTFLPIFIAITASKHFKCNTYIAILCCCALVNQSWADIAARIADGDVVRFLGVKLSETTYTSTVLPPLLLVWVLSYLEHFIEKKLPDAAKPLLTPLICFVVMVPATIMVIGPASAITANAIANGYNALVAFAPALAGAIIGGLWQVVVIFGVHWGITPVVLANFDMNGCDTFQAFQTIAVVAQVAAAFGVFIKSRNKEFKGVALSAGVTGIFGITEPTIYGVTLRLKKPFICGCAGGAVGAVVMSFFHDDPVDEAEESEEETKKITGTEMLSGEKQEQKEQTAEIKKIESPLAGTVIPLSEVHDEVFASEMMGKGCAVIPEEGKVYAPFDGKVVGLLDSHHAVGMESTDGVEILIHVGMDTVKLNGRCFTIHVEEGEQVKKGQLLLEFDIPGIKEAGYEVTTPIVVTNSDEFNDVEMKAEGQVTVGVELLELS